VSRRFIETKSQSKEFARWLWSKIKGVRYGQIIVKIVDHKIPTIEVKHTFKPRETIDKDGKTDIECK
jgi:hypothetical protein